jgi:predicted dehydrogenase
MDSVNIAVIGCGWVCEKVHLPALAQDPRVHIAGVYDSVDARAVELAERFSVPRFNDLDALLKSDADAVLITTPPTSHYKLIKGCLLAGKNVVCEKPFALAHADAIDVVKLADDLHLTIQCCMSNRHRPDLALMKDLVGRGAIGRPQSLRATWFRGQGIPRTAGGLECGVIWDLGSHLVDIGLWSTGWNDVDRVFGYQSTIGGHGGSSGLACWHGDESLDDALRGVSSDSEGLVATFGGGEVLDLSVSWAANTPFDSTRFLLMGTEGTLYLDTVFGFTPDRQQKSYNGLMYSSEKKDWEQVAAHVAEPNEYRDQWGHFLGNMHNPSVNRELDVVAVGVGITEEASKSMTSGRAHVSN